MKNRASRYHLVMDAINNAETDPDRWRRELMAWCQAQLSKHTNYVTAKLEDMPEIRYWTWQRPATGTATTSATKPMR